jgi:hypothetical protein
MQLALMDEGTEQAQLTAINTAVINNGSLPGLRGKCRPLQQS